MAAAFSMQYCAKGVYKERKERKIEEVYMATKLHRNSVLVRKVLITSVKMVECNHISLPKTTV